MGINYLAPTPYASFITRNGAFTADVNGLISNVGAGAQALDLLEEGCVPLAYSPFANFRNLIDGGDFSINPFQRNIPGLASGNALIAPIAATPIYFADRFFAVGGAASAIVTSAIADVTLPGFNQSLKVARQAGNASLSPIYLGQVIETFDSLRCQNQTVTLSFWARTGLTYSGGPLTVQLIYGSGVNQSAASVIAGTWTGQATVLFASQSVSGAMTRYQVSGLVPANATQLAALISFTPTGTAGADDSIVVNGVQLEIGASASPFERIDAQVVLEICQRYAWLVPEPAAGVVVGAGANSGAASQVFYMATPVQLLKAPTVSVAAGAFKTLQAGVATSTTIAAGATHTPNAISVNGNSPGTAGQATMLQGGGGAGWILASADF